jgi:hypothetical protein
MTRHIKIHVECVLPVPGEIQGDLDAVAEAGLSTLRALIEDNVTTLTPGTLHTSWQSMPQGWQPKKSNIILAEEVAPGFTHTVDSEERIGIIEDMGVTHPWDQGLWIFPEGHPLHHVERPYREHYLDPQYKEHLKPQLKESMRELEG